MKELKLTSPKEAIKFKFEVGVLDYEKRSVELLDGTAPFKFVLFNGVAQCPNPPYALSNEKFEAMRIQAGKILKRIEHEGPPKEKTSDESQLDIPFE